MKTGKTKKIAREEKPPLLPELPREIMAYTARVE